MRLHFSLAAVAVLGQTVIAQRTLTFTVNEPASTWNWSGQVTTPPSLGSLTLPVVGNPSNATVNPFQLNGTVLMGVQGGSPATAAQFAGGAVKATGGIHGKVNNPIPFQPALGTLDVGPPNTVDAIAGIFSPSFPVAGDQSFSALIHLVYTQGVLHIVVQGYGASDYTFGTPNPTQVPPENESSSAQLNGTLVHSATGLTLTASVSSATPLRLAFQRDLDPGPGVQNVTGFFDFWGTLTATHTFTPAEWPFCFGDGTDSACPCANPGLAGRGCNNTVSSGGALITSTGTPSISSDTLVLNGQNAIPFGPGLFYQGSVTANPSAPFGVAFGNGLRCAGGATPRLEIRVADGTGASSTTVQVHLLGADSAGDNRNYQLWYRDSPNFGSCTSGFNLSSAINLTWVP